MDTRSRTGLAKRFLGFLQAERNLPWTQSSNSEFARAAPGPGIDHALSSLTIPILRRLYTRKSEYAKTRFAPGLTRSAGLEDSLAPAAPSRLWNHVGYSGHVEGSAPRRGRFALPCPAS